MWSATTRAPRSKSIFHETPGHLFWGSEPALPWGISGDAASQAEGTFVSRETLGHLLCDSKPGLCQKLSKHLSLGFLRQVVQEEWKKLPIP